MPAKRLLVCCQLALFMLLAEARAEIPEEAGPSMAFLEYLGGVETEIDGRLSSPVELDLESAVVAGTREEEDNATGVDMRIGTEEKIDE